MKLSKILLVVFFIISHTLLFAQEVVKESDFTNTDWFSENKFNELHTKDTIVMFTLKSLNGKPISGKKLVRKYFKKNPRVNRFDTIVLLDFQNSGELLADQIFLSKNIQNSEKYNWKYNEKDRILSFIMDDKVIDYQFLADMNFNGKMKDEKQKVLNLQYKQIVFKQIRSE